MNHINHQNPHTKFTNDPEKDGQLPFLDTLVKRQSDGSLQVSVYRKPTHTDQYLAFDSYHPLEHKLSVVRMLFHRAETVVITPEDKDSELKHVKTALKCCGYHEEWSFKRACVKKNKSTPDKQNSTSNTKSKINVVIPFVQGLSEKIKCVYSQCGDGASTAFKPHQT